MDLYFPIGHVNQDREENFFSRMRSYGGHRLNPSAADIPSAFLRGFVTNATTTTKKKNCKDDEGVMLFDFEELWEGLRDIDKPAPIIVLEDEADNIDLGDDNAIMELVLQMEEEEELDVQASAISAGESQPDKVLRTTASIKAAAPVVNTFLSRLKCTACKSILLTEAQFPDHL